MKKNAKSLLVLMVLGIILCNTSCRDRESNMFRSMVTRYRMPPQILVFIKETGEKKRMDMEEYLTGVVAGEMKPNWPVDAYAAQAIIARTFTMEFLSRGGTRKLHGTDISTDETEAQAYNAANITPVIRKAIQKTKGKVLTYKNRYVKAWYSASSGGLTTFAKEGLGYRGSEPPYISSVKSPEEEYMPQEEFYWNTTLTSKEVNAALRKMNKPEIGEVKKMEIVRRTRTNRAVILKFIGEKDSATVVGADFRVNYDPQKMRSIWISDEINNQPGAIGIKGRGFGHGVGLSQWGAYAYAKKNWSPEKIVKHYYPKAKITKIW